LRERLHPVQSFTRCYVEHAFIRPGECNVRRLSRHFDGPPAEAPERRPTVELKIAVALHLHYPDLWPEFEALLEATGRQFQLFLTLTQPDAALAQRVQARFPGAEITVDLVSRTVHAGELVAAFDIDDYTRWRLLEGLDDIGLTLRHEDAVSKFEESRPAHKPVTTLA